LDWIPCVLYLIVGLGYHGNEFWVVLVGFTDGLSSTELHHIVYIYMCVCVWIINNSMHCLSSIHWGVITPLHVSGLSAAHHQKVECMYIYMANGTCYTSELTVSVYTRIYSTSWWWVADMPETCRGVLTQ
jgi:hypothetical protein